MVLRCNECNHGLSVIYTWDGSIRTVYHFCIQCDGIGTIGYRLCTDGVRGWFWDEVYKPGHTPSFNIDSEVRH
jgi:hypothetical protein